MAATGFLALAASSVAGGYLYLRRRYSIDPQVHHRGGGVASSNGAPAAEVCLSVPAGLCCAVVVMPTCLPPVATAAAPLILQTVYRLAMYRLNTHAGLLEASAGEERSGVG